MALKSETEEEEKLQWDPVWDEDPEDAAASQDVGPVLQDRGDPLFVNLSTTTSLMTLKGSLASILAAAGTTELYASLLTKLEEAVPEEDREDYAALVIQRTYRRISERRNAKKRRAALHAASCLRLQSTYRGHLARRYVLYRHLAAARIQGLGRGRATRVKLRKEKQERCAKQIQRWFRACVIRDLKQRMQREKGAILLQRVYRGHVGRVLSRYKRETDASTLLQRVYRGHAGRLSAKSEMARLAVAKARRMEKAASMFQALYRGFKSRKRLRRRLPALVLARKIRMAARVQRTFRGYLGRVQFRIAIHLRRIDAFAAAITPIQSLGRGHIVRQRARDQRAARAAAEAAALAVAVELLVRGRGAKAMQTTWRRWTARKLEAYVGAMAGRIQLWYRVRHMAHLGRQHRRLVQASATRLQAVAAGHLARVRTRERRAEVRATKLQAVFRGHQGRAAAAAWRAEVKAEKRRLARLRRLEREAREKAELAVALSNRGQIEVFTQAPQPADTEARRMQIVPHYMKARAHRQQELLDPRLDPAVLAAVEMDDDLSHAVRAAGELRGRSDEYGWGQAEPALDPYQGAEYLLLQRVKHADPALQDLHHFPPPPAPAPGPGPGLAGTRESLAQTLLAPHPSRTSGGRHGPRSLAQSMEGGGPGGGLRVDAVTGAPSKQIMPHYLARKLDGGDPAARSASAMELATTTTNLKHAGDALAAVTVGPASQSRPVVDAEARRRSMDVGTVLRPGERAHLDRVARLDARLGWSKDAAGEWHRKPVRRPRTASREREGGAVGVPSLERLSVYDKELVDSRAVRKRFNLDAVSAKNQTLRQKLATRLGGEGELPLIPQAS